MKVLKREFHRFESQKRSGVYKTILEPHEIFEEGEKVRISLFNKNGKFQKSVIRIVLKIVLCAGEGKISPNYRIATFAVNQPKPKNDE